MGDILVEACGLTRTFKSAHKGEGLMAAVKAFVRPHYSYTTAVDHINISISRGEIRGFIGPNGAGKSTTLKMLSGVLYPTSGSLSVLGYTPWINRQEFVRHIGVVFGQKSQLWWDLPPIDTFKLHKSMYRITENNYRRNFDFFVELLALSDILYKPVRQLSLGERMKCELVCALLHEPALIFLDEPTIGVDVISKENIRRFIKEVNHEKKTTFILTTHDLNDIEDMCEQVTIINRGTIVHEGSLSDLRRFFAQKKRIEIELSREIDQRILKDFCVIDSNPLSVTVEIDYATDRLQQQIADLVGMLPVRDINISPISIEELIARLYREEIGLHGKRTTTPSCEAATI